MNARPVLRAARPDDVPALAALWETGWHDAHDGNVPDELTRARPSSSFTDRLVERIRDTTDLTVAEIDGTVAGFVAVIDDEIDQVYVAGDYRGAGIAAALLAEGERRIAAAGHTDAWLAVAPGNARARRFYEKQGWSDGGGYVHRAPGPDGPVDVPTRRYVKRLVAE
ncbi:GNAT family N-acetyltransferase [Spongisporangium articulatum]|uniref:GNAT family N-acetyltransferase n=1 Tax=Spongisporangium articulatum TaxID=3362603 RepID=A0ABW8AIU3_9ACTN